jgi:hypothetical protein
MVEKMLFVESKYLSEKKVLILYLEAHERDNSDNMYFEDFDEIRLNSSDVECYVIDLEKFDATGDALASCILEFYNIIRKNFSIETFDMEKFSKRIFFIGNKDKIRPAHLKLMGKCYSSIDEILNII